MTSTAHLQPAAPRMGSGTPSAWNPRTNYFGAKFSSLGPADVEKLRPSAMTKGQSPLLDSTTTGGRGVVGKNSGNGMDNGTHKVTGNGTDGGAQKKLAPRLESDPVLLKKTLQETAAVAESRETGQGPFSW